MKYAVLVVQDEKGALYAQAADGKYIKLGPPPKNIAELKQALKDMTELGGRVEANGAPLYKRGAVLVSSRALKRAKFDPDFPARQAAREAASAKLLEQRKKEHPEDFKAPVTDMPRQIDVLDSMTAAELLGLIKAEGLAEEPRGPREPGAGVNLAHCKNRAPFLRAAIRKAGWKAPEDEAGDAGGQGDGLEDLKKAELLEIVEAEDIEVPQGTKATVKDLIEAIRTAREDNTGTE